MRGYQLFPCWSAAGEWPCGRGDWNPWWPAERATGGSTNSECSRTETCVNNDTLGDHSDQGRPAGHKHIREINHSIKKVKVAHTQLRSTQGSRADPGSWQVTWIINPAVGCHYFLPGLQLPSQSLRGLLPVSLLGERRHNWCEQFACYPTALRLLFEPRPFCTWVQHANHSANEPPNVTLKSLFTFYASAKNHLFDLSISLCVHLCVCTLHACGKSILRPAYY